MATGTTPPSQATFGRFRGLRTTRPVRIMLEHAWHQVLTAGAMRIVMIELLPEFESKTEHKVVVDNATAGTLAKRIADGEAFNVAIITPAIVDDLMRKGKIAPVAASISPPAFDFAKGKPLELIEGPNLLYLLEEHAGITAKIEVPDDWLIHGLMPRKVMPRDNPSPMNDHIVAYLVADDPPALDWLEDMGVVAIDENVRGG